MKLAQASSSRDPISTNPSQQQQQQQIGLVEWLKVKALSSSHCTAKNKRKNNFARHT
jgi:hypothetical protein